MNRREVLLSGIALSLAGTRAFAQAGKEILIGCIWPLTGPTAQIGADARHALETAADIVNNAHDLNLPTAKNAGLAGLGGAKIKLVFADHQGDPQKGRAEAERLITQDKVVAICARSIPRCRPPSAPRASATAFPMSPPTPRRQACTAAA